MHKDILLDMYDFFVDIWIVFKLFFVLIYFYGEVLFINISQYFTTKDISGKTVLITGAAGGIGKNLVEKFVDLKCTVLCLDKNQLELKKLQTKYKSSNQIETYCINLCSINDIRQCCEQIRNKYGLVDIVINNAGIVNNGKMLVNLEDDEIASIFDVNIMSYIRICKEFLPKMIELNQGHIVNVSSILGLMGSYKLCDYSATKFAVNGFTESMRNELKCSNSENKIKVTLVCPFHVRTEMFKGIEFFRFKWAGLSMSPKFVADRIVNGILYEKELVLVPSLWSSIFFGFKNLLTTKFCDHALEKLKVHESMNMLKTKTI